MKPIEERVNKLEEDLGCLSRDIIHVVTLPGLRLPCLSSGGDP